MLQKPFARSMVSLLCLWSLLSAGLAPLQARQEVTQSEESAAKPDRIWYGVLDVQVTTLRLVFEESKGQDGKPQMTAFSLDQGNAEMKVDSFGIEAGELKIELKSIGASFSGKLNDSQTEAVGQFTQGGRPFPMTLKVVDAVPGNEPDEIWDGMLEAGPRKLKLRFRVFGAGKPEESVKFDSPNEGVFGLPAIRAIEEDEVTIRMEKIGASFSGTLNEARDRMEGEWEQGGGRFPFVLEKLDPTDANAGKPNRPQTPQAPFSYESVDVTFENTADGVTLAGTLTLPAKEGRFPVAVMISGSGPQDRDETLFDHKPFLVIADDLARRGIAVLRFDDRGVGKSTGDFGKATSEDFARDVEAAVAWLQKHPAVDPERIGLIGHSEGGLIAPMVAARNERIAFAVLLAGPGVDGGQIVINQTEAMSLAEGMPEEAAEMQSRLVAAVVAEAAPDKDPGSFRQRATDAAIGLLRDATEEAGEEFREEVAQPVADGLVDKFENPWMKFFLFHDPTGPLQKTRCPVLVLNGEKDTQVDPALNLPPIEAALKAGGNTRYRIEKLASLNHLFQTCETGGMSEYNNIEETLSPLLLDTLGKWLEETVLQK